MPPWASQCNKIDFNSVPGTILRWAQMTSYETIFSTSKNVEQDAQLRSLIFVFAKEQRDFAANFLIQLKRNAAL